jgi:hypothetical protein
MSHRRANVKGSPEVTVIRSSMAVVHNSHPCSLAILLPLLIHCSATPSSKESETPTPKTPLATPTATRVVSATLPVREMRFVGSRHPDHPTKTVLIVHDDGRVERIGATDAHVQGGRILCPDGSELLSVDAQDRVSFDGRLVGRITAGGDFVIEPSYGSWSITVLNDGSISMTTRAEGRTSTDTMRWEGVRPEARRTAAVLSALLTPAFGGWWCGRPRPGSLCTSIPPTGAQLLSPGTTGVPPPCQ